jgi:5-oxoprolinase (ATP-hydrolysing) subunit C
MSDRAIEIIEGGVQSTVQDYPGRLGRLADGVSQAGPMDHFAFRVANALVGNPAGAAGLEVTLGGLRARFGADTVIALCGTPMPATLNGEPLPLWESVAVAAGDELRLRMSKGPGFRAYLAFAGGIDVPEIFGSRATHTLAGLGGLEGRALKKGDRLALAAGGNGGAGGGGRRFDAAPAYAGDWDVEVMIGPQADPDFLTAADVELLCSRPWKVDANSNRVGLRLEPFQLEWARSGGGIAGGHPSNILDDGYPPGGINMNGDTAVILGPDGPTSGGFVVVATVVHAAIWKLGQIRPGTDRIRFVPVTLERAVELDRALDAQIGAVAS